MNSLPENDDTCNSIVSTAISSFQNTRNINEVYTIVSSASGTQVIKFISKILPVYTGTPVFTNRKCVALEKVDTSMFASKNTQTSTNGSCFILSTTQNEKYSAKIYEFDGDDLIYKYITVRDTSEGSSCAISPLHLEKVYTALGVPDKSQVNLYSSRGRKEGYEYEYTFSLHQGGGTSCAFIYGSSSCDTSSCNLYLACSSSGSLPQNMQDKILRGSVHIFSVVEHMIVQVLMPPSGDYYLFGNTLTTSSTIKENSNKLLVSALKRIGHTFYKVVLVYSLNHPSTVFDNFPQEIIQTDISLSGCTSITDDQEIITSGISYLTSNRGESPEYYTKGHIDVFQLDSGTYKFKDQLTDHGYAVTMSNIGEEGNYLIQTGNSFSTIVNIPSLNTKEPKVTLASRRSSRGVHVAMASIFVLVFIGIVYTYLKDVRPT